MRARRARLRLKSARLETRDGARGRSLATMGFCFFGGRCCRKSLPARDDDGPADSLAVLATLGRARSLAPISPYPTFPQCATGRRVRENLPSEYSAGDIESAPAEFRDASQRREQKKSRAIQCLPIIRGTLEISNGSPSISSKSKNE